jgi:hypothetical protein
MKRLLVPAILLCACAALAGAQAGTPPRIVVINYSSQAVDVRVGDDASAALRMPGIAAKAVTPLSAVKPGSFPVFYRAQGAAEWSVILENLGEGAVGGPKSLAFAAGGVYALGVFAEDGMVGAAFQELAVPAGNKPRILFTATRMGPPRAASVATAKDAPGALVVEEITQYQVTGLHELPSAGKRSVFFTWPAFYESLTHFLPDAKDASRPAVIDFQDGGVYAVVLERFDETGAAGSITTIATGGAAPSAPAASALTAVPAAWNGDWAVETRPTRKTLAIHDGRIFLVMGTSETETFPGTTSKQYSFTYAELEVATLLGGKPYEKYVLSPDGTKLTQTAEGRVTVYVRLQK